MRTVLAVAALLVTAGCAGVAPTDGVQAPAPADGYPPGVTESGLQNASELVSTHVELVETTGYAFDVETTTNFRDVVDGEPYVSNESLAYRGRTAGNVSRVEVHRWFGATPTYDEQATTFDAWWNESSGRYLSRAENGQGTVTFRVTDNDGGFGAEPDREAWTRHGLGALSAGDYEVTNRYVADGRTLVVLEADRALDGNYDTYRARLVVDLDGRIHEFEVESTFSDGNKSWAQTASYELTHVGVESIPEPAWREAALALPDASLVVTSHTQYVELWHERGETLPAGSTVEIAHDGETQTVTLDRPVAEGDRLYVTDPADGELGVSFAEPGDDTPRLRGEYHIHVFSPEGYAVNSLFPDEVNVSA
ncbi:hypothetical protein [Halobacterium litoreum]|uniref:Uncharacterized protein n=1 Tax=Halobacterium litoreum TaxID=2039234 RepID=A0ABD5NGM0_9EURY|nr:hypothetical protein [Halobacterium litoreum]UHH12711.1 hypothetical protein LT972_11140 [Halobacterium litoreum]